jgi:hypothetical protein
MLIGRSLSGRLDYKGVVRRLAAIAACAIAIAAGTVIEGQRRPAPVRQAPSVGLQAFDAPQVGALSPRNASYRIDVRLDHERRQLAGRSTITWRNITANPTSELQFHLYWNAWRNASSSWMRERRLTGPSTTRADAWGSVDVAAIRVGPSAGTLRDVTQSMRFIAPDDGNADDRTVMTVPAERVDPNATVTIEIDWTAKIPRPFARTGYVDDYYFIAQWFPKIGVLEDAGWNTHQFHTATEFYADYGVYDVRITLPAPFVLGASGRRTARTENADGSVTHRYVGEDIHDFAWTASPEYEELTRVFEHATLPRTEMRLLLLPEHRDLADRYFDATAAALKYYGEWFGAYPYGYVTIVDPAFQSGADGMEYPTLLTGRSRWLAPPRVSVPESTTTHEAGHQFWYGIVATNEFEHAWMDEGLNTFSTARTLEAAFPEFSVERRYFGGFVPWVFDIPVPRSTDGNRLSGYRDAVEADVQATPTFHYWPGTHATVSYNKTALWLHTLERHLGWATLQKILATYFERWKFRHPRPQDFFDVANEVSGQDLRWFFDQVYRSSNAFDYGVQELVIEPLAGGRVRSTAVARRYGEATFPVEVVTTFADGEVVTEKWDGLGRRAIHVYERAVAAVKVEVDPRRVLLLDVNYTNNSRLQSPRNDAASLKWSLAWMVWLQDLMLTYGFFV